MKLPYLAAFLLCLATAIAAQKPSDTAREYTAAHRAELVQQFSELLSIPNVAADPANLKRNADVKATGANHGGCVMLAEIFMIRLEAVARAAKEAANSPRFVPVTLPAAKAS